MYYFEVLYLLIGGITMPRLTQKGQVTIPIEIRNYLGVLTGDDIEFIKEGTSVIVRKKMDYSPFNKYAGYSKTDKTTDQIMEDLRGDA